MTNLLTSEQAAEALRCDVTDTRMLDLLSQVDRYIENATGRDWTQDDPIVPEAVSAATMLLTRWFENPAVLTGESVEMPQGLSSLLLTLEIKAIDLAESA